jgi:hypothetical protein
MARVELAEKKCFEYETEARAFRARNEAEIVRTTNERDLREARVDREAKHEDKENKDKVSFYQAQHATRMDSHKKLQEAFLNLEKEYVAADNSRQLLERQLANKEQRLVYTTKLLDNIEKQHRTELSKLSGQLNQSRNISTELRGTLQHQEKTVTRAAEISDRDRVRAREQMAANERLDLQRALEKRYSVPVKAAWQPAPIVETVQPVASNYNKSENDNGANIKTQLQSLEARAKNGLQESQRRLEILSTANSLIVRPALAW